jgi:RNA polymerase sigma-70 factor (ECF subfamily)
MVFNLYVLDGHSHKEIAELMEISEGTSKSNLARGRQILKDKINEILRSESQTSNLKSL